MKSLFIALFAIALPATSMAAYSCPYKSAAKLTENTVKSTKQDQQKKSSAHKS